MNRTIPCFATTLALTASALVACAAEPDGGAAAPTSATSTTSPATASPARVSTTTPPPSSASTSLASSAAATTTDTPTTPTPSETATSSAGTEASSSGSPYTWRMTPSFPGLLTADEVSRFVEVDQVESAFARGEDYPLSMAGSEASLGCPEALEVFNEAATDVDDIAQIDMVDSRAPLITVRLAILRDPGMPALADAWDRVADVCQGVPLVPQGPETRSFDDGHGLTFLDDDTDAMGASLTFRRVEGHPDVLTFTQVESTPSMASAEDVSDLADAHVDKVLAGLEEMAETS